MQIKRMFAIFGATGSLRTAARFTLPTRGPRAWGRDEYAARRREFARLFARLFERLFEAEQHEAQVGFFQKAMLAVKLRGA